MWALFGIVNLRSHLQLEQRLVYYLFGEEGLMSTMCMFDWHRILKLNVFNTSSLHLASQGSTAPNKHQCNTLRVVRLCFKQDGRPLSIKTLKRTLGCEAKGRGKIRKTMPVGVVRSIPQCLWQHRFSLCHVKVKIQKQINLLVVYCGVIFHSILLSIDFFCSWLRGLLLLDWVISIHL